MHIDIHDEKVLDACLVVLRLQMGRCGREEAG